jgi:Trm5-related predicted tRNA methylase
METICGPCSEKNKRLVKQTHKTYDSPRDKLYSIKHHVDYRNNQSGRLCVFHSKDNKQELEFLKEHGSNNQLFLTLRKQITNIQKTDKKIHDMSSAINLVNDISSS